MNFFQMVSALALVVCLALALVVQCEAQTNPYDDVTQAPAKRPYWRDQDREREIELARREEEERERENEENERSCVFLCFNWLG